MSLIYCYLNIIKVNHINNIIDYPYDSTEKSLKIINDISNEIINILQLPVYSNIL